MQRSKRGKYTLNERIKERDDQLTNWPTDWPTDPTQREKGPCSFATKPLYLVSRDFQMVKNTFLRNNLVCSSLFPVSETLIARFISLSRWSIDVIMSTIRTHTASSICTYTADVWTKCPISVFWTVRQPNWPIELSYYQISNSFG